MQPAAPVPVSASTSTPIASLLSGALPPSIVRPYETRSGMPRPTSRSEAAQQARERELAAQECIIFDGRRIPVPPACLTRAQKRQWSLDQWNIYGDSCWCKDLVALLRCPQPFLQGIDQPVRIASTSCKVGQAQRRFCGPRCAALRCFAADYVFGAQQPPKWWDEQALDNALSVPL
jgi:hypothetical protein